MNARILAKYHEKRAIKKAGVKRICITPNCKSILSKYNTEPHCEKCKIDLMKVRLLKWGWSQEDIDKEWDEWR